MFQYRWLCGVFQEVTCNCFSTRGAIQFIGANDTNGIQQKLKGEEVTNY